MLKQPLYTLAILAVFWPGTALASNADWQVGYVRADKVTAVREQGVTVAVVDGDFDDVSGHGHMVVEVLRSIWDGTGTPSELLAVIPVAASQDDGTLTAASVSRAIRAAVDGGADVINISLAGNLGYYDPGLDTAVKYARAHNVVVVAAAGNAADEESVGTNLSQVKVSPVCNDAGENLVLGVGVVDSEGSVPSWSNTGRCVDVFAPGVMVNGYATGSSFAAPIVSAAAALLRAGNQTISAAQIHEYIASAARLERGIPVLDIAAAQTAGGMGQRVTVIQSVRPLLVKQAGSPTVYVAAGSWRRPIENELVFRTAGFAWADVMTISPQRLAQYKLGETLGFADDDVDHDGLILADEVLYGTDSANQDSDGDGYLDGEEVAWGYNPLGPGRSATGYKVAFDTRGNRVYGTAMAHTFTATAKNNNQP